MPVNLDEAEKWFRVAVRKNDADAQYGLAMVINQRKSASDALPWLRKAAAQGHPQASRILRDWEAAGIRDRNRLADFFGGFMEVLIAAGDEADAITRARELELQRQIDEAAPALAVLYGEGGAWAEGPNPDSSRQDDPPQDRSRARADGGADQGQADVRAPRESRREGNDTPGVDRRAVGTSSRGGNSTARAANGMSDETAGAGDTAGSNPEDGGVHPVTPGGGIIVGEACDERCRKWQADQQELARKFEQEKLERAQFKAKAEAEAKAEAARQKAETDAARAAYEASGCGKMQADGRIKVCATPQ
jgi:hypothetical protein